MTNVLQSYVVNESSSLLVVLRAMLRRDTPASYDRILSGLPSDQMVVVWGEGDTTPPSAHDVTRAAHPGAG